VTSPSTNPPKVLGSSQLYTAATILGVMLLPHVVLAAHLQSPAQAFNLHGIVVLLLFGLGMRAENTERAAAALPRQRKKTAKKPAAKASDTLAWLDRSIGESGDR
jgi:small neutral amino acid transporter SnatA (MarC family)